MDKKIRVVTQKVGEPPKIKDVENDYKVLKQLVGGLMETVPFNNSRLLLVCNEEGKLDRLEPNVYFHKDIICGDIFITKFDGGEDFESLNEREINFVLHKLDEITLKQDQELKPGKCSAITYCKAYNATHTSNHGGVTYFVIPGDEPVLGYLQSKEQIISETKEELER